MVLCLQHYTGSRRVLPLRPITAQAADYSLFVSRLRRRARVASSTRRRTLGAAHRAPVPEPAVSKPQPRRHRHRVAHRPVLNDSCVDGPTSGRRRTTSAESTASTQSCQDQQGRKTGQTNALRPVYSDTTQLNSTRQREQQLTQFVGRDVINKNITNLAVRCSTGSVEFS